MSERAPLPGWPRYLTREEAAEYVGVSSSTFDQEIEAGQWPQPRLRGLKGTKKTWDRVLLDAYADHEARLQWPGAAPAPLPPPSVAGDPVPEQPALPSPMSTAEAAALRGIANATTKHRPKHRQQKAA